MTNPYLAEYKKISNQLIFQIKEVLESGHYILGPKVQLFESTFSKYIGTKYAVGVANGMDAIQIILRSLGIGPGDEVITTSLSAVATTLAITQVGATPIFVDIDDFFHIDASKIESAISKKTKAIIPVHLYGQPVDIENMQKICSTHNIHLIEDCAQAHGAMINNRKVGTFGHASAFSFYPTKNLGAYGDAGALLTNDDKISEQAKMLRNYGQKTRYTHEVDGINSRLDELQSAILLAKLPFLDEGNAKRAKIAKYYNQELHAISEISCPINRANTSHVYHQYVIRTKKRDELLKYLQEQQISALIHYPIPIHKQPCFPQFHHITLPKTEEACDEILSLPIHPMMTELDQEIVVTAVNKFFQRT